jgi:uncharacterized membrane protein YdjX (TVP38/TMEM64 family)
MNMMATYSRKLGILCGLLVVILLTLKATDYGEQLSLVSIQNMASFLDNKVESHYLASVLLFIGSYILVNLWFPAAALLTLLGGFLYGVLWGSIYVEIATTTCATLAFCTSRNVVGTWIQHKWQKQLQGFNHNMDEYGYEYLLLVRLVPLTPYILVNFLAGLTQMRLKTFIWTTALGSLPGILIFSYAGRQLLNIRSTEQILSSGVLIAFILLIIFFGSIIFVKMRMSHKQD